MGCGILALGLWFLYGLKIQFNGEDIIPAFIGYIFILWALFIVFKKYKNMKLKYAFILTLICFIFEILPSYSFIDVLSCFPCLLQLYFLLQGIIEIIDNYNDLELFKKKCKRYIINFTFINLIVLIKLIFNISEIELGNILVVILVFQTIGICRQMIKINNHLYSLDEPVMIKEPISINKMTSLGIMFISILALITVGVFMPDIIYNYSNASDYLMLNGKSDNINIECFQFYQDVGYDMFGEYVSTSGSEPYLYINPKVLNHVQSIKYSIYSKDIELLSVKGEYILKDEIKDGKRLISFLADNDSYDSDFYGKDFFSKEYNEYSCIIIFYDQDEKEVYKESFSLENSDYKEYGYEDDNILIKDVYVYDDMLLFGPYVKLKPSFYEQYENADYEGITLSSNQELDIYHIYNIDDLGYVREYRVLKELIDDEIVIRINVYKNGKIIDTLEYTLEEFQ